MLRIFGSYAKVISPDTLTTDARGQHRERFARLVGARLIAASEIKGAAWNAPDLNALVSGEPITANFMHKNSFEFTPQAKLLLIGNERPRAAQEAGIWRRMVLLEFPQKVPRASRDVHRKERLMQEAPQILGWMLDGARRWYLQRALPAVPPALEEAVAEYRGEQNVLKPFLDDCYLPGAGLAQPLRDAHQVYLEWCKVERIQRPLRIQAVREHYEAYGCLLQLRRGAWWLVNGAVNPLPSQGIA